MKFIEKLQEFNTVRAGLKTIIGDLTGRKAELETKIQQAKISHEQALIADLEDGNKKTLTEIARLDRIIEDYEKELANVERRLEVAKGLKQKRLSELIPELKKFRDDTSLNPRKRLRTGWLKDSRRKPASSSSPVI